MTVEDEDTNPRILTRIDSVVGASGLIPPWLVELVRLHGKHEIAGAVDDPWIKEAFRRCGLPNAKDDIEAWCSAGLCRAFDDVGVKSPRTAGARKWLNWGIALNKPALGAVQVWNRVDLRNPKNTSAAHVNLHVADLGVRLAGEGCNQLNAIGIDARLRKDLLGIRWPDDPRYPPPRG